MTRPLPGSGCEKAAYAAPMLPGRATSAAARFAAPRPMRGSPSPRAWCAGPGKGTTARATEASPTRCAAAALAQRGRAKGSLMKKNRGPTGAGCRAAYKGAAPAPCPGSVWPGWRNTTARPGAGSHRPPRQCAAARGRAASAAPARRVPPHACTQSKQLKVRTRRGRRRAAAAPTPPPCRPARGLPPPRCAGAGHRPVSARRAGGVRARLLQQPGRAVATPTQLGDDYAGSDANTGVVILV
jgi:hypothetical protein